MDYTRLARSMIVRHATIADDQAAHHAWAMSEPWVSRHAINVAFMQSGSCRWNGHVLFFFGFSRLRSREAEKQRSWENREAEKQRSREAEKLILCSIWVDPSAWTKYARIMHDNHHLQSTVAQQNTGETRDTVLSRRATALLRRLRIRLQSALEINLRIHAMRAITLLEQLVWQSKLPPFREKAGREKR